MKFPNIQIFNSKCIKYIKNTNNKTNQIMVLFLISIIITYSMNSFSQERKDEPTQTINFTVERKSDVLKNATGWSQIENKTGKVWEPSQKSDSYNYLPNASRYYSFQYIRLYELSSNGKIFYALAVKRTYFQEYDDYPDFARDTVMTNGSKIDYFFFSESGMNRLKEIVNVANGITYTATSVKYYKSSTPDKNMYNSEIAVTNKELQAIFQTTHGTIGDKGNLCENDSLFTINCQVLKGDTVVRFNVLTDVSSDNKPVFSLLPINNFYYEVPRNEFIRLFRFTPYITKDNLKKADAFIKNGNEKEKKNNFKGATDEYTKAIEIDGHNASYYYKRALSKNKMKEYPEAINDFSKAIEIDPDGSYYYARGLTEIESGLNKEGCLDFSKAVELGVKKANNSLKENCK